jgi:hypothetical protein
MQQIWNSYIKTPSKQFDLKNFSTYRSTIVNPGVWSGLIDGEGSFSIIISKSKVRTLGFIFFLGNFYEITRKKNLVLN